MSFHETSETLPSLQASLGFQGFGARFADGYFLDGNVTGHELGGDHEQVSAASR